MIITAETANIRSFVRRFSADGEELPSISVAEAIAAEARGDETLSITQSDDGLHRYLVVEQPNGVVDHVEL